MLLMFIWFIYVYANVGPIPIDFLGDAKSWRYPSQFYPVSWSDPHLEVSEVMGVPQIIQIIDAQTIVLTQPMVTWGSPMT